MKTRITLEVNAKIYNKVLWILSQFKVDDVRIIDEYAEHKQEFEMMKKGGSEFVAQEGFDSLLQDIEVNYEKVRVEEVV